LPVYPLNRVCKLLRAQDPDRLYSELMREEKEPRGLDRSRQPLSGVGFKTSAVSNLEVEKIQK
jgi:hypothetical protein